uniref:Uncharacterized protein n=1 Tax=Sinocyclocheilus rhinocerous TaxID=307959 RepID=A0A673MWJ3_9TELE
VLLDYCWRCCGTTANNCPSTAVLQNLLMCMLCFFSLYYLVVSLCIEKVKNEIASYDPFNVISTEVTHVLGGLIFAWIVEECAITVTLLHVALTVAVMADFPSTEHWWIALGKLSLLEKLCH